MRDRAGTAEEWDLKVRLLNEINQHEQEAWDEAPRKARYEPFFDTSPFHDTPQEWKGPERLGKFGAKQMLSKELMSEWVEVYELG